MRSRQLALAVLVLALAAEPARGRQAGAGETCLTCHFGIEDMHPWEPLTCTQCHGGNPKAETKEAAHVRPLKPLPNDERVLPFEFDSAYLRFKNPSNLRVVDKTCGQCHQAACADLERSLHGTTAGHLSDGMYECGILPKRGSRFGMRGVQAAPLEQGESRGPGEVERLLALPGFDSKKPRDAFASHYADLVPKNCVRCHLYSPGQALRGRLGMDGDYRAEGCAACHVSYADDGLARGGDPTVDKFEPGHPLAHQLTSRIPTTTCVHCHYGDASIGLNFRGLAQLFPGQPAGPEVQGTTEARLNQTFYVNDPLVVPPDLHHEAGMHCIDCHTVRDVMGDGKTYGQMPHAVEIECEDCHGTLERESTLETSRGNRIENLVKEGAEYFLVSKVTGAKHRVKQAAHVVNPRHPDYVARAAEAMKPEHARLECYACHAGWSPNFFGFHFERQEQFTQLDLMSGERTPGRVNTQEKVFATFRGLYLGWNSEERIAPYMVGFSSMGSVSDEQGRTLIDQQMPVTAAGLSGMTMIHHQLHTTRREARDCADCHRNPTALGLGSPNANFRLGRNFAFVGSTRGLDVIALDRKQPGDSIPIATLPVLGVRDVALAIEPLQGFARHAYLAIAGRGVMVVDLENPAFPRSLGLVKTSDPRGLLVAGDRLYLADGAAGVAIFDLADPSAPKLLGRAAASDARDVELSWPHLFVADHAAGLRIIDVTVPARPAEVATVDLNEDEPQANEALGIALLVQPSRPSRGGERPGRSAVRVLAAVACDGEGLRVADVTDPKAPELLRGYGAVGGRGPNRAQSRVTAVAALSKVDLGSPDGTIPTQESDYFFATVVAENRSQGRLFAVLVDDPRLPKLVGSARTGVYPAAIAIVNLYNPPFLQHFALVAGGDLFEAVDVSKPAQSMSVGQFAGLRGAAAVAVESMPLDRLIDESGRAWKDISHEGARFFSRLEVDKILRADVPVRRGGQGPETPGGRGGRAGGGR